jgi:hypothetical protein
MATEVAAGPGAAPADSGTLARSLRRGFLIAAPVLAGGFAVVGAAADPAVGESGPALWAKYADNPEPLQWKSFGFHWAYAFWTITAFMLAGLVRARGVWLANAAGLLAFVGVTTLPGLLIVDFYDSAIGQIAGVETTRAVNEAMEGMWAVRAIVVPGVIGALFALPLAALAAWRAGIVRAWAVVAAAGGVAAFILSGVTVWGTSITAALFSAFAYALWRSDRI